MRLRDYQLDIVRQLKASCTNDLVQLDTGGGKTPIEAAMAKDAPHCLIVAHLNVLISQISEKLAAFGLHHDSISTEYTRRRCMAAHRRHGRNYIRRGDKTRLVASIDSLIARYKRNALSIDRLLPWLILIDEAHHVLPNNKWGVLRDIFPNARIIGLTATPARMDGESLHKSKGGLFDRLIQAEALRENSVRSLIDRGYLSSFSVYSPQSKAVSIEKNELKIAGDPLHWYLKLGKGKQALAICPSINNAREYAKEFRRDGVPAAAIDSKMPATDVSRTLDAFAATEIKVLFSVDMVGEGFDLPGIEVLLLIRETRSFPRFRQWVGRALRTSPKKEQAIIIDLVGNVLEHGMPDDPVKWDLLNPPCGLGRLKHAPCQECYFWYPVKLPTCPQCCTANALHDRAPAREGHYIKIIQRRVDMEIVRRYMWEQDQAAIGKEKEAAKALQEERMKTEIIWPEGYCNGRNIIEQTKIKLAQWFADHLINDGIPHCEVNKFFRAKDHWSFFLKHFTAADLRVKTPEKARKVFEKWQKSR